MSIKLSVDEFQCSLLYFVFLILFQWIVAVYIQYSEHNNVEGLEKDLSESCAEERELSALDTTISKEKMAEFQTWREHDESLPMFCEIDGKEG